MDIGAIAELSTDMKMAEVQQSVSLALMSKVMTIQESAAEALISDMENSAPVSVDGLGRILDTVG